MQPYTIEMQLRWSDEDRNGHVNNARFMTYSEDARLKWLAVMRHDLGTAGAGNGAILARQSCDYLAQVHVATTPMIAIDTYVVRLGTSSVALRQIVRDLATDDWLADMASTLVCFDYRANSPAPFNDAEREWCLRYHLSEDDAAALHQKG
ncbi:MAG: thioesterase family protein [Antricoccus sp.]